MQDGQVFFFKWLCGTSGLLLFVALSEKWQLLCGTSGLLLFVALGEK